MKHSKESVSQLINLHYLEAGFVMLARMLLPNNDIHRTFTSLVEIVLLNVYVVEGIMQIKALNLLESF